MDAQLYEYNFLTTDLYTLKVWILWSIHYISGFQKKVHEVSHTGQFLHPILFPRGHSIFYEPVWKTCLLTFQNTWIKVSSQRTFPQAGSKGGHKIVSGLLTCVLLPTLTDIHNGAWLHYNLLTTDDKLVRVKLILRSQDSKTLTKAQLQAL